MPRIIFLLLLFPLCTIAQKKVNLTLFGGMSNYSGDLQEKRFTTDQSYLSLAAGISYEVAPKVLIRGALQYGKIGADDKKGKPALQSRNLNFQSRLYEASLLGDYSLFDLQERKFTPYVFAGVAVYHYNPYTHDTSGNIVNLRNLGTEGQGLPEYPSRKKYQLTQFAIPFGAGIRLRINDNTVLGYEIGLRKTFTDYLDDVSTTYVDEATLAMRKGALAAALAFRGDELKDQSLSYPVNGTKRGGSEYKDWYYFSGITLSVGIANGEGKLFGKRSARGRMDCPRVL